MAAPKYLPHLCNGKNEFELYNMKKILVPVDFSPNSFNALHIAAGIAHRSGAALEILHVNLSAIYSTPMSEYVVASGYNAIDEKYDESAMQGLEKVKKELLAKKTFADLSITLRVEEGFLHTCLRNVAQEDDVDLIVMGTKGSSGMNEFLIGSNTEKVIRTAPCPILAVPEGVKEFTPKLVLMPSTLKSDQAGAFHYLGQWEKYYNFRVKVLYLNNPLGLSTDGSVEAAKNRMIEAAGLKKTDVVVTSGTLFEDDAILEAADRYDAELVVMATHQRQGLSHMMFGSVTEDTVNHSQIPVLAIPIGWRE